MACILRLNLFSPTADFGCGFFVFGCFKQVLNVLGLLLLFSLGLKLLQFSYHSWGLLGDSRNGFCSNGICKFLTNSSQPMIDKFGDTKESVNNNSNVEAKVISDEESDDNDDRQECCGEDYEYDVMGLRKLVKMERNRANSAYLELEKERMAATTAAEEAMAMILRLQNEKSLIGMEARQYRRLVEEKQKYDEEVIQYLQWMVMKHESERSVLEDHLRMCRRKLKLYMKGDEVDEYEGVEEFLGFPVSNEDRMG